MIVLLAVHGSLLTMMHLNDMTFAPTVEVTIEENRMDRYDPYTDKFLRDTQYGILGTDVPDTNVGESDTFMKAVWKWLLDYQIKVAEIYGKYSPYEVLSWVANDWRREHE